MKIYWYSGKFREYIWKLLFFFKNNRTLKKILQGKLPKILSTKISIENIGCSFNLLLLKFLFAIAKQNSNKIELIYL